MWNALWKWLYTKTLLSFVTVFRKKFTMLHILLQNLKICLIFIIIQTLKVYESGCQIKHYDIKKNAIIL